MIDGPYKSNSWRYRLLKVEGVLSLLAAIGGLVVLVLSVYQWVVDGAYGNIALVGIGAVAVCLIALLNNGRLREKLTWVGKWITVTAAAIVTGGSWAMIPTVLARRFTAISEANAWLFIFLPVSLLVIVALWPKLPKIMGFENE